MLPDYASALKRAANAELPIVLYENEHSNTLHHTLTERSYHSVALISGPEGGFEESEIAKAMEAGIKVCTLGRRILRCETRWQACNLPMPFQLRQAFLLNIRN